MERQIVRSFFEDPQNIIAFGVTLVSVCALMVSIYQTRIMTEQRELMFEQAKAEVWPHISMGVSKGHNQDGSIAKFIIGMGNDGVGPAIIKGVRVTYKGQTAENWWDLFDQFEKPDSVETYISNSSINDRIVKIDEEFAALDLDNNLPLAQIFYREAKLIQIEVLYESIYGDSWLYTHSFGKKDVTQTVDQDFQIPEEEQFES